MATKNDKKVKWHKTSATAWASSVERTYTATISFLANVYTLTINPGAIVTVHATLKTAKNQFRKFLFDK